MKNSIVKKIKNPGYIHFLLSLFFLLNSISLFSQNKIAGHVLDAETELPLSSFVLQADSIEYQFSDGTFNLELSKLPAQVIFKAKGYFSFNLQVSSGKTNFNIRLIPENVNLQEVIVKAFNSEKRLLDTPGSLSMINNLQMSREPSFTLAPSVNKTAGVWMQSGTINTNRLTIRGIGTRSSYGTNKIRAYYGSIPLTNGVGETTLEDLDMEQISNIEIVKGPSSGFYGSGLGGVLLFNPVKPLHNQFAQYVSIGSYQTIKYTGKLAVATKNAGHSLVYSDIHSDGYRENNATKRNNLTWTSTFAKNKTKIDLLAAFINMHAYIPSSINLKMYEEMPEKAAPNWAAIRGYEEYRKVFGGLSVQQTMQKNWQASIGTFGQYQTNHELRPFNTLQEKNHYLGFRSVLEKKYTSEKATARIILGDEFFTENYQWQTLQNDDHEAGDLLSDNQEYRWYNNVFLLSDVNFQEKFTLSASLNLNQTNYRYEDQFLSNGDQSGNQQFSPILSPRLAFNWLYSEKIRFYSVVSHGFSPPTLEETLMPGGLRNTSIQPETGWNFELGSKGYWGKSLFYEITAYYMKVKNLLVAQRTGEDEYMGVNAGGSNHPGLEFRLDYRLINRPIWSTYFKMNANLTNYRFSEFVDKGQDYSGNKLTGTPATTTNWMIETTHSKGLFLNLHYQTVGSMPMRDDNSIFTDPYALANLMAGYEISFKNLSFALSSGVQNLLNTHYASMILINATAVGNQSPRYYYPGLLRNYKTTVSLKYTF
jgi:iron complex outermembrane recepter protein